MKITVALRYNLTVITVDKILCKFSPVPALPEIKDLRVYMSYCCCDKGMRPLKAYSVVQ